jgi:hypothetical protein
MFYFRKEDYLASVPKEVQTTVKHDLLAAMGREYPEILKEPPPPARPGTGDWLAEEQDFHERFMESRLQVYVGRENIHKRLLEYLEGDSTRPLLLSGGSGTGKSGSTVTRWVIALLNSL